ncbi:unnamed protein product [Prorocentrum cordatum]|uniref:Uncharacterized protein n=1 Tax=Prorocentrum cordatum TaxID=2364126 RepID=A0ABN9Y4V1_9DINO|nr:unnamed protein product [Polarella glacialis]
MAPTDVFAASIAAQVAFDTAMAVMEFGVTPKQQATLLAAVARGAACGTPAQAAGAGASAFEVVQEVVDLVKEGLGGDRMVRIAKEKLREQGSEGVALARRIGRATKARSSSAHSDERIVVRDAAKAAKNGSARGCESLSTVEADLSEKANDCSKEAAVGKFVERELADKAFSLKPVALRERERER